MAVAVAAILAMTVVASEVVEVWTRMTKRRVPEELACRLHAVCAASFSGQEPRQQGHLAAQQERSKTVLRQAAHQRRAGWIQLILRQGLLLLQHQILVVPFHVSVCGEVLCCIGFSVTFLHPHWRGNCSILELRAMALVKNS